MSAVFELRPVDPANPAGQAVSVPANDAPAGPPLLEVAGLRVELPSGADIVDES